MGKGAGPGDVTIKVLYILGTWEQYGTLFLVLACLNHIFRFSDGIVKDGLIDRM